MITPYKQIHPQQCQRLSDLGFKSLINLRFDDETDGQPTTADICHSATSVGLSYHHLPVDNDSLHLDTVERFARILKDTPKPVMVFCGTGNRAKRLYQCAIVSNLL
ncbi:MAG: sulfur transferase domain-containing protein [Moraxella sp.]|nr:sulfur transferase domain-containing protein [Moraxella sp.]